MISFKKLETKNNDMMKRLLLFLILVSLGQLIYCQRPGYMGKRFSLSADMSIYPALYRPVVNDQIASSSIYSPQWFGMNYRLTVGFDAILTQKSTIGIDFNYYHSATSIDTGLVGGLSAPVTREFEGYAIGLHYRVFLGDTKAPVGFYYKVESGCSFYSMNNTTAIGNFYLNNSIGRQHVFFNRLILNYGISLGVVMPSLDWYYDPSYDTFAGRLTRAGNMRSLNHWGINVYGGLGVLLF
jgi:hypothetical protein